MSAFGNILQISEVNPPASFAGYTKVVQTIMVVAALPATPLAGVTYLIGAQSTIAISGINGNISGIFKIIADIFNPSTNDSLSLRFNGINTNVYDYRYSQAGTTTQVAANAQNSILLGVSSGTNSINHLNLDVDGRTGLNRNVGGYMIRGGANQLALDANYMVSGNWRDSSTNMVSMTFGYASISGGFGVGTTIRLEALQVS